MPIFAMLFNIVNEKTKLLSKNKPCIGATYLRAVLNSTPMQGFYFMEQEIWKDVNGYEGIYKISNFGNLLSFYKLGGLGKISNVAREQVKCLDAYGYYTITLCKKGEKHKRVKVHRLVATGFIPNPNNYPCVNHKNGIKTDNRVENLEWVNHRQNQIHAVKTGLCKVGISGFAKLTKEQVLQIRIAGESMKRSEIAKIFKVSHKTIRSILNKQTWKSI